MTDPKTAVVLLLTEWADRLKVSNQAIEVENDELREEQERRDERRTVARKTRA